MVKEISSDNFEQEVVNSDVPVLIDCWAPWCMPCRIVSPVVEEVSNEYVGKVKFGKLNVDENQEVAVRFGIMSIPTLLILKENKLVDQIIGAVPKQTIKKKLDNIL